MDRKDDLPIGHKSGKLTVVRVEYGHKAFQRNVICVCECDPQKEITFKHYQLTKKLDPKKSCGCGSKGGRKKHGLGSRKNGKQDFTYTVWQNMRARCFKKYNPAYPKYGGRGITVCDRWKDSFENFLADMGYQEDDNLSIERIDNNGDYSPENCRWATAKEQANNRRSSVLIKIGDDTKPFIEWCETLSICPTTVYARMRKGMTREQALVYKGVKGKRIAKVVAEMGRSNGLADSTREEVFHG
jgi:hypothetical protein